VRDVDCVVGTAPCLDPDDAGTFTVDEAEVTFWGRCGDCRNDSTVSERAATKERA
jgi:Fur family ferric uptake transcriptional regulator